MSTLHYKLFKAHRRAHRAAVAEFAEDTDVNSFLPRTTGNSTYLYHGNAAALAYSYFTYPEKHGLFGP